VSEPKLHHYVPRFHLERFTSEKGHVWTFDKSSGKVFAARPTGLAAESQFYRLPEFEGTSVDPLFLEKQFAQIESEASNITNCWLRQIEATGGAPAFDESQSPEQLVKALDQAPRVQVPDINREIMSQFIALQFFRTADSRELLKLVSEASGTYKERVSEDESRSLHAHLLCQLADGKGVVHDLAGRLKESVWMFARNHSSTPFETSDTPVLLKTPDNRKWLKGPGIFQKGMYVVYALTPTVVLYCKERTYWKSLARFDNFVSPVTITSEMAQHENSGHAGMSARFVFSCKNDFAAARSFVENPSNFPPLDELLEPNTE